MDTPKSGFSTRGLRSARIRSPKGTVLNRSSPLPVTYRHPALLSETTGFGWALRDAKCGRQALSEGEDSEWMGVTGVREEGRISQQGQKHRRQCVATFRQGSRVQVPPVPFFIVSLTEEKKSISKDILLCYEINKSLLLR